MSHVTESVAGDDPSERRDYVRLLDNVTNLTDEEPDESFADEEVLAKVDELCCRFRERVRAASIRP